VKTNPESLRLLKHIGSFNVELRATTDIVDGCESLPAHEYVLPPLLSSALECKVYGIKKASNLFEYIKPITSEYRKGCIFLDLTKEVVKGYERLWNADLFERSSIVIVTDYDKKKMKEILGHCGKARIWASRYMLNLGQSKAAIRYCQSAAQGTKVAISLANSIEYMDLFAQQELLLELFRVSKLQGKSFKIAPTRKCHIDPRIIRLAAEAIRKNDLNKLKALVEQNPDLIKVKVFELTLQATMLHSAAWKAHLEIAEFLISRGADVNARDRKGRTPLHTALWRTDNIAELLISKGADIHAVDSGGWTPLHYASNFSLKESVSLLLAHGANMNAQDKKGYTALDTILIKNYESLQPMAEFLRRHGGKSWSDFKKNDLP
jgi:hypothetical protein